jgi:hypothetical protein
LKRTTRAKTDVPVLTDNKLGAASGGAFNGFVNFGDIKGESTDKDHKDWVTILAFDHSVTAPPPEK